MIPRLNGFEILMASYAMAHLKLDLLLQETGYNASSSGPANQRFKIYLTNSLEEHYPDSGTLFANWLSEEANEANHIKRDTPVMVVMGNPPYSGVSSNMGKWISDLIEDYKYVDGEHFGERKHWLHDDYVKFLRYGQYLVDKNGEGVLAFINNHSFIDNPTFRGMRWNLLKSFDKIYVLDLHGNSIRKEVTPEMGKDENVFDITAGVSINLFIKNKRNSKNELAEIFEYDLWGLRDSKYDYLHSNNFREVNYKKIAPTAPYFFFRGKDNSKRVAYEKGLLLSNLLIENSMGVTTARDYFVIDTSKNDLIDRLNVFFDQNFEDNVIREKFFGHKSSGKYLKGDTRGWKLTEVRKRSDSIIPENILREIEYRIFDRRFIAYSPDLVDWGREEIMNHMLKDNYALNFSRVGRDPDSHNYFITKGITDKSISSSLDNTNIFPLYLYPEESDQHTLDGKPEPAFAESGAASAGRRTPNLDKKLLKEIETKLGLKFVPEKAFASGIDEAFGVVDGTKQSPDNEQLTGDHHVASAPRDDDATFAPIDLLDYIYAVLHSPAYREKYKEFLKIDFPRVPYPEDPQKFWQLVKLGGELRQIHLLEADTVEKFITTYPIVGDNFVRNRISKNDPGFVPFASETKQSSDNEQLTGDHVASARESESNVLGKVWINEDQYFDKVPLVAWEFYIGGYQPAQKWLKDRRDRELSIDDIRHYQKIIVALTETDRIMKEIDEVGVIDG